MADYATVLKNVDATSRTVGSASKNINATNFISIWWGLVVLVFLTVITLWLVKKYLKNEAGNLWDFLSSPYKGLIARWKAADSIEKTGVAPTIDGKEDAKGIADAIYNCFQPMRDDEETLFAIVRTRIANAADWDAVKGQFGVRDCPKPGSLIGVKHTGDMEHVIAHNLSTKKRAKLRKILVSKHITTTI